MIVVRDARMERTLLSPNALNSPLSSWRPAFFAGRRIYGLVRGTAAAGSLHRSFGAKRRRLTMARVELAHGTCGNSRRVPRFSRPLREAGKFADINTNREGKKPGGKERGRARLQSCHQAPMSSASAAENCRSKICSRRERTQRQTADPASN